MRGRQPLFKRQTFATFAIDPSGGGGGGGVGGFHRVSWAMWGLLLWIHFASDVQDHIVGLPTCGLQILHISWVLAFRPPSIRHVGTEGLICQENGRFAVVLECSMQLACPRGDVLVQEAGLVLPSR